VQKALRSLPWVREAKVDYAAKAATVVVERKSFAADQLVSALKKAGFGGEVQPQDSKQKAHQNPAVTFHVIGMKKTKSGAT
jgi:cation transport ATPase